ncbi:alpha/beta hydrolase [Edaphobacter aggregans]|uniref:alpha/beta hydrolase n=1 Tax=Edaphobacter aggregans TaxID=570835 RepID=UPI00055640B2|nr:dienelactone hydrolase family protein [Edaphobacter aggregans]
MTAATGSIATDPHRDQPVRHFGAPLSSAEGVVILLHGRGGSAEDILSLAQPLYRPRLTYLAPQAAGHTWYPNSFLAPIAQNQPWLDSALRKVEATVEEAIAAGIAAARILLGGFSQGACLASEFVASHPRRYAGLIALTGGLIGPPGMDLTHAGSLAGTPAFFGSGDPDPHVPFERVQQSAAIFTAMGASVTVRRYPGRPHTISPEELDFARRLMHDAFPSS